MNQWLRRPVRRIAVILAVVGGLAACDVNAVPRQDEAVKAAWSQVLNQYQRRADLIPNLVETVKGYAAHERGTFDAVVRARGAAVTAATPDARARAEGQLSDALRQLFALAESYPELKASQNFQSLQDSLAEIEDSIQNSRRYYNAVVRDLNTTVDTFPSNFIASSFRFEKRGYFELDRPEDRQAPRVSFGS